MPINIAHLAPIFLSVHLIGGHVGLPLLIITWLWSKSNTTRHPTLINFCFTWVVNSLVYCLTLYTGRVIDSHPRLCFAQAILVHGAPPMAAVAGLTVVIQLWRTLQDPQQPSSVGTGRSIWPLRGSMALVLILPYITFLAFVVASVVIATNNPAYVDPRNGLYCTLSYKPFQKFGVPLFSSLVLVVVLAFEVAISVRYFFLWKHISRVFPMADRKKSLSMILRVTIYNLYSMATLCASISFLSGPPGPWPYMIQAALPLVATVVFGTQMDVLLAWCWWKKRPKFNSSDSFPIPSGHSSRGLMSETDSMHISTLPSRPYPPTMTDVLPV